MLQDSDFIWEFKIQFSELNYELIILDDKKWKYIAIIWPEKKKNIVKVVKESSAFSLWFFSFTLKLLRNQVDRKLTF